MSAHTSLVSRFLAAALAAGGATTAHAATITLVPVSGGGFSDATAATPEGGNTGMTVGQQRTILFNTAAQVWATALTSNIEIKISAQFTSLFCDATSATLGSAGATGFFFLTIGSTQRLVPVALAEALANQNANGTTAEINANFNSNIGSGPGCLGGDRFYYGLTGPAPADTIALYPVVLHELAHGLGFSTLICTTAGGCSSGTIAQGQYFGPDVPDTWGEFLRDNDIGSGANARWFNMTNAQRVTSFTHDPLVVWDGMSVTTNLGAQTALNESRIRMFAPNPFQGGSSLSHYHSAASPNLLMEPALNSDVFTQTDLTDCLFADIGWENSRCAAVINTEPTLNSISNPAAINEDATQQTINMSGIADGDAIVQTVAIAAASGNTGLIPNPTVGYTSPNTTGTLQYTPVANQSGSALITVTVTDDGGVAFVNGGDDTLTRTFTVNVTAVNDAPVLDASRTPVLASVNEDAGAPSGAVGTLASALVDFASPSGQVDNVTDIDSGPVTGIAVTANDATNGTWHYSTNGGLAWQAMGTATAAASRLLAADANTRVYFQPNANFNGSIATALTIRAWDQTNGTNGNTASTSSNGGTTAFSTATDTVGISVTGFNDAPVLDASRTPVLNPISENAGAPSGAVGTLVSALVDFTAVAGGLDNVTDPDASAVLGIAVTAAATANGTWHYSTNGGTNWLALGSPADATSRLLAADANTRVYFQPNASFAGTSTLTFRAWDQTSGANGNSTSTSTNGGATAFSSATDTTAVTVNGTNDAPTLDATKSPVLGAIAEDSGAPSGAVGSLVSTLVDFAIPAGQVDNVTDPDAGALLGVALVGSDPTNGDWFFSTDNGASWNPLGNVISTSARLLAADANTRLYFQPDPNFAGAQTGVLQFKAWDRTSGTNGTLVSTATSGGTTAFSSTIDTIDLTVTGVNDAPALDAMRSPVLGAIGEDAAAPTGAVGTLVSSLVDFLVPAGQVDNVTDADTGALLGLAVTAVDATNGSWFYTTNGGTNWIAMGSVSDASARLLAADANTRVYFQPSLHFNGTVSAAITLRAWDQTSGTNGTLANTVPNGGTTAFSTATDTASLTVTPVNDAPQLNAARSPMLGDQTQNDPAPVGAVGTLVSALVDFSTPSGQVDNVLDPDGAGALLGISVNATNESSGTLFFSTNNGVVWMPVGAVTLVSARLLAADANTRLYFQPTPGSSGTIADGITFRAWDQTSGANGALASNNPSGGTTAFSNTTDTASITVDSTDTAPVANPITPAAFAEDTESTITLSYTDAENDLATECAVALNTNVDITTGCACTAGVCTVGATGTADYSGPASFVYQVTANGAPSNTALATLSITPVNDAPTLDAIADPSRVVVGSGAQTIALSGIGAGGGELQTLTVTAMSDNASVIADPSVSYTSPNTTGMLTYTPLAAGTAIVTVTVTDDGGTAAGGVDETTRTFTVEVLGTDIFEDGFENP